MRVLIINQYFPPDTSATARVFLALAGELEHRGHSVTVLAGRPSYRPQSILPWRPLQRHQWRSVIVERVGSTSFVRDRIIGRVINYISFVLFAAVRVLMSRKVDVVVVGTDPPLAVLVALLAAKRAPVVYSLQDLHPEGAVAGGWIGGKGVVFRRWQQLHQTALKRCTRVVCLGERMRLRLLKKGLSAERLRVVPNGAEKPEGVPDVGLVGRLRDDSSFVVVHAGNIGTVGAWDTLLEASRSLGSEIRLLFVGEGAEAGRLRLGGATVVPFLPADQLTSVMAAGDLQVVTMKRQMVGVVVPSKLYSILAHGRPVLAVVPEDSEVADVVREMGCGWVANPDDPNDVVRAIEEARSDPAALSRAAAAALKAGEGFDRSLCMSKLADIVEQAKLSR